MQWRTCNMCLLNNYLSRMHIVQAMMCQDEQVKVCSTQVITGTLRDLMMEGANLVMILLPSSGYMKSKVLMQLSAVNRDRVGDHLQYLHYCTHVAVAALFLGVKYPQQITVQSSAVETLS